MEAEIVHRYQELNLLYLLVILLDCLVVGDPDLRVMVGYT